MKKSVTSLLLNSILKIYSAYKYSRRNGLQALITLVLSKSYKSTSLSLLGLNRKDILEFYEFLDLELFGVEVSDKEVCRYTLNWFIPPCGKGSGGHLNIFRFIYFLEKQGFECRIVIVGEPKPISSELAKKQIIEWYFPVKAKVYIGTNNIPPSQSSIATSWITAYYVKSFQSTLNRVYFVQDYEPFFYALGSDYAFAEETYKFRFYGITAGDWLKNKLEKDYGMNCSSFSFSYDKEIYRPSKQITNNQTNCFFYARPPTDRRGFQLGILTLQQLCAKNPDLNIIFAGWDASDFKIPFKHTNAGTMPIYKLPELYAQCSVALVLSFTNLSLLPLELMACGVPIVSNRGDNVEWLLTDFNSILTDATPLALCNALHKILTDPTESNRLKEGGFSTAATSNWEHEACKVGKYLQDLPSNFST